VQPSSSDGAGTTSDLCTFDDRDGVSITAFLTFDPRGNVRELNLWKADDSAIVGLPETFD
jgi:hypothetical protein